MLFRALSCPQLISMASYSCMSICSFCSKPFPYSDIINIQCRGEVLHLGMVVFYCRSLSSLISSDDEPVNEKVSKAEEHPKGSSF